MDLKVIADAIATRFAGLTANGESIVVGPTAGLPNAITAGPALLVYPPTGELGMTMGRVLDTYDFPVRLLRDPLDVPSRTAALYAWATAMRPLVWQQFTLGIAGVTEAKAIAMRVQIDGQSYGTGLFDLVEIIVRVQVFEIATGVAP
jgi:hypothetical protein